jgi:hypothetical protein
VAGEVGNKLPDSKARRRVILATTECCNLDHVGKPFELEVRMAKVSCHPN